MTWDLNDPVGRLRAAEALGHEGYKKAMEEHIKKSTIKNVAGHDLRRVRSQRFGPLIMVGKTNTAFRTIEEAVAYAEKNPA
jgi:hypothetical protein